MTLTQILADVSDLPDWAGCSVVGVESRNGYGDMPLHVAAVRGDVEMISVLLAAGAEIDARGEHGFTPLLDALAQGKAEAARLLIQHGASTTSRNDWGFAALEVARNSGYPDVLALK